MSFNEWVLYQNAAVAKFSGYGDKTLFVEFNFLESFKRG